MPIYQRKYKKSDDYNNEAAEREKDYRLQNVTVSRYGQPPPNWYEGEKVCPFSGKHCANWKCMAWSQETPDADGYCIMIGRFKVN